jgi:transaldolase
MTMATLESPLLRMVERTPTQYWNDSCAVDELVYAVERGATGATSNPVIVAEVMKKEKARWAPRVHELAAAHPTWSEVELAWAVVDEMAVAGAAVLQPVFERAAGRCGRISVQTNPANYRDPERMVEQALHFAGLAPNIQVKFPVTSAGLVALEEATYRGVNITGTVSFTVAQAVAIAESVERGLARRAAAGHDVSGMAPIAVIMIGRLDDWMKVLVERDGLSVDPGALNWAGIAAFKRAYAIFRERGYRTRLLSAAYRHHLHWTELVGGDVSLTIPWPWQVRFNRSGIDPLPRMDLPIEPAILDALQQIPDFRRAYEPDGLTIPEFDTYGATVRTLRGFIASYHDLLAVVRDVMLPNPDLRPD